MLITLIILYKCSFWETECRPNPGCKSAYWLFTDLTGPSACSYFINPLMAEKGRHVATKQEATTE
jgi:hypothetical protein